MGAKGQRGWQQRRRKGGRRRRRRRRRQRRKCDATRRTATAIGRSAAQHNTTPTRDTRHATKPHTHILTHRLTTTPRSPSPTNAIQSVQSLSPSVTLSSASVHVSASPSTRTPTRGASPDRATGRRPEPRLAVSPPACQRTVPFLRSRRGATCPTSGRHYPVFQTVPLRLPNRENGCVGVCVCVPCAWPELRVSARRPPAGDWRLACWVGRHGPCKPRL